MFLHDPNFCISKFLNRSTVNFIPSLNWKWSGEAREMDLALIHSAELRGLRKLGLDFISKCRKCFFFFSDIFSSRRVYLKTTRNEFAVTWKEFALHLVIRALSLRLFLWHALWFTVTHRCSAVNARTDFQGWSIAAEEFKYFVRSALRMHSGPWSPAKPASREILRDSDTRNRGIA